MEEFRPGGEIRQLKSMILHGIIMFPLFQEEIGALNSQLKTASPTQLSKPSLSGMRALSILCQAVCALPAEAFPLAKQISATTTNITTISRLMD